MFISSSFNCARFFSSFQMVMRSPRVRTTRLVVCLTFVRTRNSWCTRTTTLSAASPPWPSPRVAVCCSLATMTSTATCGTRLKESVQVSTSHNPLTTQGKKLESCSRSQNLWDLIEFYWSFSALKHSRKKSSISSGLISVSPDSTQTKAPLWPFVMVLL